MEGATMKGGDVIYFIFVLILVSLLVRYWKGAVEILKTSGQVGSRIIQDLQVR
jgi:hypothetical protein